MFKQAKIAAACAGILFIITYVPYMYIAIMETSGEPQPVIAKILTVSSYRNFSTLKFAVLLCIHLLIELE